MTLSQLRRWMSTDEYVGWMALYELEQKEREIAERRARSRRGRKG